MNSPIFEGADEGRYPNGLPFARSEIVAAPVLTEVYEANELERYGTYEELKNGIFILESNRELDLLGFEFQTKLADTRLTPVDRASLEEEFRQRRQGLQVPQYVINYLRPSSVASIPDVLLSKVLSDALSVWADQAATRRGVLNYQTRLYTPNLLSQEFPEDDYVVRADILRGKVNRFIDNLADLEALPGISVVRVGENRISLSEIRANMEDLFQYRLDPLTAYIWNNGLSRDADLLGSYMENRRFETELDLREAEGKSRSLEEALRAYVANRVVSGIDDESGASADAPSAGMPALITQFGDSFLDRLIALAGATEDVQYRQQLTDRVIGSRQEIVQLQRERAYYNRMNDVLGSVLRPGRRDTPDPEAVHAAETRFAEILDAVVENVDQANAVYTQVSAQNLNPRTALFTITSPFTVATLRGISLGRLALYGVIALVICLIAVPLICLLHHYLRQQIRPAGRGRPPDVREEEEQGARPETVGA